MYKINDGLFVDLGRVYMVAKNRDDHWQLSLGDGDDHVYVSEEQAMEILSLIGVANQAANG